MNKNTKKADQVHNKCSNFFKIGFFILTALFLLMIGAVVAWLYLDSQNKEIEPEIKPSPSKAIISPAEVKTPTTTNTPFPSPTPSIAVKSDLEQIQTAMAIKYNKNVEDVNISISENNGTHASGGVRFEGEMGGGWLLAAKVNDAWVIVDDGNGTVSCELISPYNFPVSMVPECVDGNGGLITR